MDYLQPPSSSPLQRLFFLTDIKQNAHSWEMAAQQQIGLSHPPVPLIHSANASLSTAIAGEKKNEDDFAKVFSYTRRESEGADSEASGHAGQVKGMIQGVLKPCSPKRYLHMVSAGVIRTGNSHYCFNIARGTSFPCALGFYRSKSPRVRLSLTFSC